MDSAFFTNFYPRVIDVLFRDLAFWKYSKYSFGMWVNQSTKTRNFIYVLDGAGTLELKDQTHSLSEGHVFYLPLHSEFQLYTTEEHPLLYISILYDYKRVEWEGNAVKCSDPIDRGLPFPIVFKALDKQRLHQMMKDIQDLWHSKSPDYEWKARLAFLNILNLVSEQHSLAAKDDLGQQSIFKCMEFIKRNYAMPLKRETLAREASLSASHFSVMFKKYAGYTPTQYITRIRLDKAKQLLQNSSLSVSEVAREVGFQDPLYFARVFSGDTGLSPSDYRKS